MGEMTRTPLFKVPPYHTPPTSDNKNLCASYHREKTDQNKRGRGSGKTATEKNQKVQSLERNLVKNRKKRFKSSLEN
jgi:hypothetical protein